MKKSISDKIEECRLASLEPFGKLIDFKYDWQRAAFLNTFFSETKYNRKNTFLELWEAYGLTDNNIKLLNIGMQNNTEIYRLRYDLMEKWISILFDRKIAFKPFFDIEIEKHTIIRRNAKINGISHISLVVNFENIAQLFDNQFISIYSYQLVIKTAKGAVIKKPSAISQELITALLEIDTNDIPTSTEIRKWIEMATGNENQTVTNRLHYLNVFINSLKVVEKQIDNIESKAYLKILISQLLTSIYKTIDIVEWMCDGNYNYLLVPLLKQFLICKLEHGWESSIK